LLVAYFRATLGRSIGNRELRRKATTKTEKQCPTIFAVDNRQSGSHTCQMFCLLVAISKTLSVCACYIYASH